MIRLRGIKPPILESLVRPVPEIVVHVSRDKVIEVLFAEYDKLVQTLDLDRLNPAFDVGANVRSLDRAAADIEPLGTERVVKGPAKLAVAIVEDDLGLETGGSNDSTNTSACSLTQAALDVRSPC